MFPKKQRIPKSDFSLLSKAINRHSGLFSVSFVPDSTNHFAVVVSKKCSRLAVVRNKNKRRVRHALKKISQTPTLKSGYYAVFTKKDLTKISFEEIEITLKTLISSI